VLAGKVIESHAIGKIREGDTVLTFARSSLVEGVLLAAKKQGKMFSVVVVDSRPMHEGILENFRSQDECADVYVQERIFSGPC